MKKRFWWLDPSDFAGARSKLDAVRSNQLSDWDWITWREDELPDEKEAYASLVREICMAPMFSPGKVVCCWGLPSFHSKLSDEIGNIPEQVLLIIVARPNKTFRLYSRAKSYGEKNKGTVELDSAFTLTKDKCAEFTVGRAKSLGLRIAEGHAKILADLVGIDPNLITNELRKLKHFCEDGIVTPYAIEQVFYGEGEPNSLGISKAILSRKEEVAHELVSRSLAQEPAIGLLGLMMSWSRTLLVAVSRNGNYNAMKETASEIQALTKAGENKAGESKWKKGPMWPNIGRLYFACKEFAESKFCKEWPYLLAIEIMRLQIIARVFSRKPDLVEKEFHGFVTRVIEQADEVKFKPPPWANTKAHRGGPTMKSKKRVIMEDKK